MKRFQIRSELWKETCPIVFHSFCKAIIFSVVSFQSVLSFKASAFSQSLRFFSKFSSISLFMALKNSDFLAKNTLQAARKRSKILVLCFLGVKPIVFHFFCISKTSLAFFSQSLALFNNVQSILSTASQRAVFSCRFTSSFSFCSSKNWT